MAVSPTKKTESKPAAKKAASPKKSATAKKSTPKARKISAEERYKMIETAAYYIAEHNDFNGSTVDFWIAAEVEIDKKLK